MRVLCVVLAAVAAGCSRAPEPPPRDPSTQTPAEPRIVVLSPALAITLVELGMGERIVARHGWDRSLDPAIPVAGDQTSLDYEALLRARPTHVLTEWGVRDLPHRLTGLAAEYDWRVEDFRLVTLLDIAEAASRMRELFPAAEPSDALERFQRLAATPRTGPAEGPLWEGRVLLVMGVSPVAALGPGSAHHEVLVRVGGVPALDAGSPYMTLHQEDLVRLAPDAIVLIRTGEPDAGGSTFSDALDPAFTPLRNLPIPAAEHGRLAIIETPEALLPSPRLIEVAERLRQTLGAWAQE